MTQFQIDKIESTLSTIDTEKAYCEMLDECYSPVNICGLEYEASRALSEVDPVAFQCGHSDFISSMLDDAWIEVEGNYYDKQEVEDLIEQMEEVNE